MLNQREKSCYLDLESLLEGISDVQGRDYFYLDLGRVTSEVYRLIEQLKNDYADRVFEEHRKSIEL